MIQNSRVYCLMRIYIFGFDKYWQTVFAFMDLDMIPTSKQLLQAETIYSNKNKAY